MAWQNKQECSPWPVLKQVLYLKVRSECSKLTSAILEQPEKKRAFDKQSSLNCPSTSDKDKNADIFVFSSRWEKV
jgi:hypothetical protein